MSLPRSGVGPQNFQPPTPPVRKSSIANPYKKVVEEKKQCLSCEDLLPERSFSAAQWARETARLCKLCATDEAVPVPKELRGSRGFWRDLDK